jgi:5'-phosphate synthase pdxT subunit
MKTVGVLSLQGSIAEHIKKLEAIDNVTPLVVKYKEDLDKIDGLIIPGGESTAIGKLLRDFNILQPLKNRIKNKMPVWGTCAGMILLAKKLSDDEIKHLDVMHIVVKRNAYGSQLDSFITTVNIAQVSTSQIPLVFIRAPYVESTGKNVQILLKVNENIVACREKNMLATSFHPELTDDLSFHKYFVNMI